MTGRPAAFCVGRGHVVVHGNAAFLEAFGTTSIGLPAREVLVDAPAIAFDVMDAVFERGRPLATWFRGPGDDWRLTVAPRVDPETGETYGVAIHLRARSDVPILAPSAPG